MNLFGILEEKGTILIKVNQINARLAWQGISGLLPE